MANPAAKPIRIVLVDDHAVVPAGLRMLIQGREGMMIAGEAGNRDEALSVAASEPPGVNLPDLDLGDSGMGLIAELIAGSGESRTVVS